MARNWRFFKSTYDLFNFEFINAVFSKGQFSSRLFYDFEVFEIKQTSAYFFRVAVAENDVNVVISLTLCTCSDSVKTARGQKTEFMCSRGVDRCHFY